MDDFDIYLNDTFIESPIFDNWFKKFYPKHSLVICSPYIKKDAIDRVIELYNLNNRNNDFDLKVLIRGNNEEFTVKKSSDIAALDSLIAISGFNIDNVRRVKNLHMKAYLIDGLHLLITSGNMTNSGMFVISCKENFEGGISSNDANVVFNFSRYFAGIWKQSEPLENFYDELLESYSTYIKSNYSEHDAFVRIKRDKYKFNKRTDTTISNSPPEGVENLESEEIFVPMDIFMNLAESNDNEIQTFSLSDIPPVGSFAHLLDTLTIVSENESGITYLELGRKLRTIFSTSESNSDMANRKFGEEKGKFAAFFGLVSISNSGLQNIIKITKFGRLYLNMDASGRNNLIKDVFFDKPIIVSILKHSIDDKSFDLLNYLKTNCQGATESTLRRKVGPLKELFSLVSELCTEEELKNLTSKI